MTETLHTCPACHRANFTTRGLRAHVCRPASPSPMPKPASPSAVVIPTCSGLQLTGKANSATDKAVGAKLTELYHIAQAAELAILRFGAFFWAVEQAVSSTCGGNSPKRGPGSYGFDSWLRDHAPEIKPPTARRYRDIAEATAERFKIEDPYRVFTLEDSQLKPAEIAKREKAVELMASHSMRGIQMELGLIDRPKPRPLPVDEAAAKRRAEEAEYAARGQERPIDCVHPLTPNEEQWWALLTQPQRRAYNAWHPTLNFLTTEIANQEFTRLPERELNNLKVFIGDLAAGLGLLRRK